MQRFRRWSVGRSLRHLRLRQLSFYTRQRLLGPMRNNCFRLRRLSRAWRLRSVCCQTRSRFCCRRSIAARIRRLYCQWRDSLRCHPGAAQAAAREQCDERRTPSHPPRELDLFHGQLPSVRNLRDETAMIGGNKFQKQGRIGTKRRQMVVK